MPQLKILAWNIWMMPPWVRESPANTARARAIGEELSKLDFDIIVFVKAFDASARAALRDELGARFPHRAGPLNFSGLKLNGGVYVFSKMPLNVVKEIEWRDSKGFESMSRKGAMLLHGSIEGRPFQLIGLHMQGESGPGDHNQGIRNKQIAQLTAQLVQSTAAPDVPLFICGDFNTQRRDRADSVTDRPSYVRMLDYFNASNGAEHRITLDDRRDHNDLANYDSGRQAELDYIFVRAGDKPVKGHWQREIIQRFGWAETKHKDLAYRYAVYGRFEF